MASLDEIRSKYPQYGDMNDQKLADSLHKKYYSDLPRSDFYKKISFRPTEFYASDIAKGAGSGLVEGGIGLATGPVDLGARIGSYLANKATGGNAEAPEGLTSRATRAVGADYDPQTVPGQYAKTISSFVPAVGALSEGNASALQAPLAAAKRILAKSALAGGSSETAGQVTRGTPIEPYARVVGGILPEAAVIPGAKMLARGALRGGTTPDEIERNADRFAKAGTTASVGQATEGGIARTLESLLSKVPGSANIMRNFARNQGQQIGAGVDQTAGKIAPAATSAAAGRAIQDDVTGIFKPAVQKTQRRLYENLDQHMPGSTLVNVSNTEDMLNELTTPIKNAKNLSQNKMLKSGGMESIKEDFEKDMAGIPATPGTPATSSPILDESGRPITRPGSAGSPAGPARQTMPYEALKDLRTKINAKIQQFNLEPDVNKADLKRLAGALTKDMRAAVAQQGPKALRAFDKANAYTAQLHDDLEQLENIVNKHGGEKVFDAAMSGADRGDTTIRVVMKALPEKSRGLFSAAVLKRMGRANPSNQNELGDVFSTETFLTNWNRLSPGAKSALFDGYGAGFSHDMDRISKVASNIREGSSFFRNPSGTAPAAGLIETANNLGAEVLSKLMVQKKAAQLMTDPKFVHWLAQTTTMPKSAAPIAYAALDNYLRGRDKGSEKKKPGDLNIDINRYKGVDTSPAQPPLPPVPQTIQMPGGQ